MKAWIVVATWMVGLAWVYPLMVAEAAEGHTLGYEEVKFSTADATKNSYSQFIKALRDQLSSGEKRYEIPVMRYPSTVTVTKRFLLVQLSNLAELSVTLAVDVTNAYVVAYRAGDQSYFFRDAPTLAFSNLFTVTEQHNFSFAGSYGDLQRIADANREHIDLGISALGEAISSLSRTTIIRQTTVARSLIVSIQMVLEAVRFKYIEHRVRQSITSDGYQSFHPDAAMLSLENNWGALSTAIQQSNQGVFSTPVQLQRRNYSMIDVDSVVSTPITSLAIMLFVCRDPATSQFSPLLIRSVVADADDNHCAESEPTVRISGRNGLCVDVKDGYFDDETPIQLWTCKGNLDANQLWTLKTDGTIRSNGKCLTTSGYSPGNFVVINNCTTAVTGATRWEVWDNGTIFNPQSALVLSAESGITSTRLTVETNIYASRQSWLPGNNTEPLVTSIVGFMDLCMQANGDAVWVVECESSKAEQKWAIYADGSIRPQQNQSGCLTCDNKGTNITISSCSSASASQRWVFKNNGTIFNLDRGMVMDVTKDSDTSLQQIIIGPVNGNPNQKWLPLL